MIGIVIMTLAMVNKLAEAHAHGVASCMARAGGCVLSADSEQYSDNTLEINDDGVLTISGTLRNRGPYELRLAPYLSVDPSNPFGSTEINNLLRMYYPLYNDPASWYFRIESSLPDSFVLKPYDEIAYEIKAYPLKGGVYHVHSTFVFDYVNDGKYRYYQSVSRGSTVTVTGFNTPTAGEVTQLILPFAIGATAIPIVVLQTRKAAKNEPSPPSYNRIREGIRLYFAVKASLETVWLAGILSWFISAAYPAFYPLESRVLSMIGMIALISAIAISGYVAALAKSRKLRGIFAAGTAIASIVFYFILADGSIASFYSFIYNTPYYYSLLPTSDVGYTTGQFYINGMALLVGLIANAAAAVLLAFSIRREKHKVSKILAIGIGVLMFIALGIPYVL
ncbi:MAG TPA: hypothetical protein VFS46_02460 [Nitrososphaera sp.]|nr:hypothetical protein [Nitrososphaera sp.]